MSTVIAPEPWPDETLARRVARVVAVEGGTAWLEPEPTASCGGCLSLSACGAKGDTGARMVARRFPMPNQYGLRPGERVMVGLPGRTVLRASATAYALPLAGMLAGGLLAQALGAGDGLGAVLLLGGLASGLGLTRIVAGRLDADGGLAPRFLHRVAGSGACGVDGLPGRKA